jgi:hypothetical protein
MNKVQIYYSFSILTVFLAAFILSKPKSENIIAESDAKLILTKDGCKVYAFKVMEGAQAKAHFFTTCKGAVLDRDEFNITELENENH